MSKVLAISAKGLSKRYQRGARAKHDSMRDMIGDTVRSLMTGDAERKAREQFWALKDATFDIERGENIGIIGLNGAGKSTLLKILSRIVTPTEGEAEIRGRLGALLEVGAGFHQELTGRENVFLYGSILGMTRKEVAQKFDAIVDFAEIEEFIDTPVKRYSSGMYVRLAFAVAAHLDPDILLLDEVLSVGDIAFSRKCLNFARSLEKRGSTILFVSHNMFSIKTMCPRVIYLKAGQIAFDGPTEQGLGKYETDSHLESAAWFPGGDRDTGISITGFSIHDESGAEASVIDHGARATIRIRYNASRRIERPDFRVGFSRSDDVHCMTFSSFSDGVDIPYVEGDGLIELKIPPIKLVSDRYSASIVVREHGLGDILSAQTGGHFHVRHPLYMPYYYGVFYETGEWRALPASVRSHQSAG